MVLLLVAESLFLSNSFSPFQKLYGSVSSLVDYEDFANNNYCSTARLQKNQ